MRRAATTMLAAAMLVCMFAAVSSADLAPYAQDFEGLNQADPQALEFDGWLIFGNVFDSGGGYLYGYGVFPAPNGTNGFCAIDAGQGGAAQGQQQLSIYSDYNNTDHGLGHLIEANVFQEMVVGAADVGDTWIFQFDAKLGNLLPPTTAIAFIKTLDPNAGYALSNFLTVDASAFPTTWSTYSLQITIDAGLVGHIFQIGFASTASNYDPSGVFYDNIDFHKNGTVSVESSTWAGVKALYR